ncbi:MAG: dockerin type I repeat-containing protein [Pirellulales bacterium]|nr:dockerin type I repeat-containing protein [Pirellulales bacterium]
MRVSSGSRCTALIAAGCLLGLAWSSSIANAASFGMHFGSDLDGWGPYYVNPANGTSAHGTPGFASAYGVAAADWYEPAPVPSTSYLPGAPSSVNFKPASMGAGSVDIAFQSYDGPPDAPGTGYSWAAFGFTNANQFETVDENPMDGNPDIYGPEGGWQEGFYVNGPVAANNGQPVSGEHVVLSGFLFATAEGEYGTPWPAQDINVTISGLSSIASGYTVKLLASAQNGNPYDLDFGVHAFTPATVSDNASHSETVSFSILDDHPNYWSPAQALEVDDDPNTHNPYVSVAGMGTGTTTFTGDTLTVHLAGANEYTNPDTLDFTRTTLAGIVIEYNSIVPPAHQGDFNGDGNVDGADFVAWQTHFPTASGATLADGDANGDGAVDGADFVIWQTNFPYTAPGPGSAPVPEPNAVALALLSAFGLLFARRMRASAV